jgi:AAA15 family ATPase/GTPase
VLDIEYLLVKTYKSFNTNEYVGFNNIKPINLIIGRNNTGKSSLLDIINYCTDVNELYDNKNEFQEIIIGKKLSEKLIEQVFRRDTSGGDIGGNHYVFGMKYIDKLFGVKLTYKRDIYNEGSSQKYDFQSSQINNSDFDPGHGSRWDTIAKIIGNPLSNYKFLRISAERDVIPEVDSSSLELKSNGVGATNIIHKFINLSSLNSKLVEKNLLESLNKIVNPDAFFTDIVVQQIENEDTIYWEIFLEEEHKGRIPLSKSGSGLKTIILVLINLLLLPTILNKPVEQLIYAFEELENNLHPALQRKLFTFIQDWILEHNSTVFITTHSNVAINIFSTNPQAQIMHVFSENKTSKIRSVNSYIDEINILDDLDTKASDILQANGIIWVEGPSDRIYVNRWIELFSDKLLKEGIHYQVLFYGGRLLSHIGLDSIEPTSVEEKMFINLLLTNRNAAILIDSDKRRKSHGINDTKKRIQNAFNEFNAFCWITKGKEIENYIPKSSIERYLKKNSSTEFGQYQTIDEFLDNINKGLGKDFLRNKVKFALSIKSYLSKEELEDTYDLKISIAKLIQTIKKWNFL